MNEQAIHTTANDSRSWRLFFWPTVLLAGVALFDLFAMTSIRSLHPLEIAAVMGLVYTQSMLSAVWLGIGIGPLASRAIVALILLFAGSLTITLYISNVIGRGVSAYIVSILVVFVLGLLVHWSLSMIMLMTTRYFGWQLSIISGSREDQMSEFQFGIRTILGLTTIAAIGIALAGQILRLANTAIDSFQWESMLVSVVHSCFCAPLHVVAVFVLLTGRRFSIQVLIVAAGVLIVTLIELIWIGRMFNAAELKDYVYFNGWLFVLTAVFAAAARQSDLRLVRKG